MNICCYGRKSVYSDKSDSIDNQIRMCRDYVDMKFPGQVDSFVEYQDEAFTGANTNRPDLQRLLSDITSGVGNYDILIVYQLDRLSRDVRDFANIYAILAEHHVQFITVKESVDTTTPIGHAMIFFSAIFAQMERENLAIRVSDNMEGLAKKGYWTGGNPPYGYVRTRIEINGKKHCIIVPDPEGAKYVTWIFDTFLENGYSLQNMETAFRKQGIRTRRGAFFSTTQLHKILTMPYCVEATPEVYDFYAAKGCQMETPREFWDGTHGVMIYGRSTEKNKKHQLQPPEKWIVCLGAHEPFMPAEKWLAVQARFAQNKFEKTMKYDIPLLKGVLRCSCGSIMSVSRKKKKDGSVSSWYYCLKRMRQGKESCERQQIKCELLDQKVLDLLQSIKRDPKVIHKYAVKNVEMSTAPDPKQLNGKIKVCQTRIDRLVSSLSLAEQSTAQKYILTELERLDLEMQALKREYNLALNAERKRSAAQQDTLSKAADIKRLMEDLDSFSAEEKNTIVRKVVKKCVWDGESLFITL